MALNFKEIKETIRVKKNTLHIKLFSLSGKEDDHCVTISPVLNVSGYGNKEQEAKESFEENLRLFCDDFLKLNQIERELELFKLGFSKVKFHNKDYSKVYVDENGVLQGFDAGTIKTAILKETF